MKGAIVFVICFLIFLLATLAYAELPPGNAICDALGVDPAVEWSGFLVKTLVSAILNGVIYGVIAWLIFTVAKRASQ